MEFQKLESFLLKARLEPFLKATRNDPKRAVKLYRVNLRVSQAFYPVLNLFEIFLRNSLDDSLSKYFQNPNWIIFEINGFMSDSSLAKSGFILKKNVQKSYRFLQRQKTDITAGKLIAEQSLGFWTKLFDTHHYGLVEGVIINCFEKKPPRINRADISLKLNKIRKFRNRVYHNEPVCFDDAGEVNFEKSMAIRNDIYLLLSWMDKDLKKFVEYFDNIEGKIALAKKL